MYGFILHIIVFINNDSSGNVCFTLWEEVSLNVSGVRLSADCVSVLSASQITSSDLLLSVF